MLRVHSYPIKERPGSFRYQLCPVETFPAFAAYLFKLFAINKLMYTILRQMSDNELNTYIFFWNFLDIEGYFSFVVMTLSVYITF